MSKEYFKGGVLTDNADAITPGYAQALVSGLVRYAGNSRETADGMERPLNVIVGTDTRESSGWIARELEEALETMGVEHGSVAVLPTPALAYAFYDLGADLAISVTTDEKSVEKNGFKIFERGEVAGGLEAVMPGGVIHEGTGSDSKGTDGSKKVRRYDFGTFLSQYGIHSIEGSLSSQVSFYTAAVEYNEDLHKEAVFRYEEYVKNYLDSLGPSSSSLRTPLDLTGLKIVIDYQDGAAHEIAKRLFEDLHAEVIDMNDDSLYQETESPAHLVTLIKNGGYDLGICFSPDGSRVQLVDRDGTLIDGNDISIAVAAYLGLPKIVADHSLEARAKRSHLEVIAPAAMDEPSIFRAMNDRGALLGGTKDGCIILPGRGCGDGITAALLMAKILVETRAKAKKDDALIDQFASIKSEDAPGFVDPASITLRTISKKGA